MFGLDNSQVRQRARDNLVDFMIYDGGHYDEAADTILPVHWHPEPQLIALCEHLEAVERGEIKRLGVFMPPRHGKSQVTSRRFPARYLARHPNNYVIITSYGADLAYDCSRECRETIRRNSALWPLIKLDPATSAVGHWKIAGHLGGCIAAGVGGPITGRGCNLGIIDDPFKDYQEAQSPIVRETVWNWYLSTFRTRLAPDAAIILIQTRWHEDDLAGRLMKKMDEGDGEQWVWLTMPAIATANDPLGRAVGEALSPRYPVAALLDLKRTLGPYLFGALYQQHPRPEEGNFFKKHWFVDGGDVAALVEMHRQRGVYIPTYAAMDFAISEKDTANFNSIKVGALLPGHEAALVHSVNFRGDEDADVIADEMIAVQRKFDPLLWGLEEGQIRKAIWSTVVRKCKQEKVTINAEFLLPITDKMARARTVQGQMRSGMWLFPCSAPWFEDFKEQLLGFPNATFDDEVDSFAHLGRLVGSVDRSFDSLDLSKCRR